ncbi:MAG TPA: hypothetical protein VGL56_12915 [Fimbriimonadaceae bacterium]|jgi:N-formylglutamate amidohydrolase
MLAPILLAAYLTCPTQDNLIQTQTGDIPIILSAPHGGRTPIPGMPERQGNGVSKFVAVRDERTDELAELTSKDIERDIHKRPYMVAANFERKYVDPNRPANEAYESPQGKPYYDAYQQALTRAKQDVQKRFGAGLLLDLHGQKAEMDSIFRGTDNGLSIRHLQASKGPQGLDGPQTIVGLLAAEGYPIIPPPGSTAKEGKFDGGYIVQTYGSANGGTVDAIQLEFGTHLRSKANIEKTAQALASAIEGYLRAR